MSQIKKIGNRMEITPKPEKLGNLSQAERSDEAVTLGQLNDYGVIKPKRVYKANLTQSSTDNPTVVVLENTLGEFVITRSSDGFYVGTLTGVFPTANKCCFFVSKQFINSDTGGIYVNKEVSLNYYTIDSFYIECRSSGTAADGVLDNTTILIEVYN